MENILGENLFLDNDEVEQTTPKARIAYITAIYGNYEKSCKPYIKQTVESDFFCFTDSNDIMNYGWRVDTEKYHEKFPSHVDNGEQLNSLSNNQHSFNIAKYYKQAFYNIPLLKDYDVVVWLDGTLSLINENISDWVLKKIKTEPIITWEHPWRNGSLKEEMKDSMNGNRYASEFMNGQKQPYQNVTAQYYDYLQKGYKEEFWNQAGKTGHFGVWWTSFIAFDNKNEIVKLFLDNWYNQTLTYSTQDQVGFPYVVQKMGFFPYTYLIMKFLELLH